MRTPPKVTFVHVCPEPRAAVDLTGLPRSAFQPGQGLLGVGTTRSITLPGTPRSQKRDLGHPLNINIGLRREWGDESSGLI
jgi:hypothetical protein